MGMQEISKKSFVKEFKEVTSGMHPRKFCFVLGAGASRSSGIRSGEQLVVAWDADLRERNAAEHEKWKEEIGITGANQAEFYSAFYERRFRIPLDGYAYLEKEMEKASPGAGYAALSYILCKKEADCNIVLTTNFDHLAEDAVNRIAHVFPLVIGHEALAHYIQDDAKRPIIIKIHRDLLMDPKNRGEDIAKLDERWEEHLPTVFKNYHPVFVGYAGNDQSLMDYLLENSDKFNSGEWKLPYWTVYGKKKIQDKAKAFIDQAGGYVIYDCDFDELMILLGDALGYTLPSKEKLIQETEEEYERITTKINEVLTKKEKNTIDVGSQPKPTGNGPDGTTSASGTEEDDTGELNEAIGRITSDIDDSSPSARYRQALVAFYLQDYLQAESILRELIEQFPENAMYRHSLGMTLYEMERYEEALAEKNAR